MVTPLGRRFARVAVWLCVAAPAAPRAASSAPADCVAVAAARLIDGKSTTARSPGLIVVRGDAIVSVGGAAPAECRRIDLGGATLLPGLIDLHTHLTGSAAHYWEDQLVKETPGAAALYGAGNARKVLEAGFTTCRDMGPTWPYTDVDLKRAIDEGVVPGPRLAVPGAYVTVTGGGGDATWFHPFIRMPDVDYLADSADEVRKRVRQHLKHGADFIKIIATGAVLSQGNDPGVMDYSEDEIRAAVDQAAKGGTYVAAHAHGTEGIKAAIRAGARTIDHGTLIDDEGIRLLKEKDACLAPTFYVGKEIREEPERWRIPAESVRRSKAIAPRYGENFRKALAAGARVAFGTDIFEPGLNAGEFRLRVENGDTPMHAIQSATSIAAACMGWERRVGSVEEGKLADVIAVAGDPLKDVAELERVIFVMKGGRVVLDRRTAGR